MRKNFIYFVILSLLTLIQCSSLQETGLITDDSRKKVNFKLIAYDTDIDNPEEDRRSYYRVYINKLDSGRTTTGLESQEKYFETYLQPNRHLIRIEKWVLDEIQGRYIKLNNIEQPKPDFIYITVRENETVQVTMKSTKYGNAAFTKTSQ